MNDLYPESKATKTWSYAGARCTIVWHDRACHYCGYVRFTRNPLFGGCYYNGFRAYVPVHGGLTYATKDTGGYVYGYDCGHAGDEANQKLTDIDWLTAHTERLVLMIRVGRWFEPLYNLSGNNRWRAWLIERYWQIVGRPDEFSFGININLLCGRL